MRRWLALIFLGALGCEDTSARAESPEVREACDKLCAEQIACGDTQLGMDECSDACVADVGTPGTPCAAALEDVATCIAASCGDETACSEAWIARDDACGGTG
jgi:hypothetical protein